MLIEPDVIQHTNCGHGGRDGKGEVRRSKNRRQKDLHLGVRGRHSAVSGEGER